MIFVAFYCLIIGNQMSFSLLDIHIPTLFIINKTNHRKRNAEPARRVNITTRRIVEYGLVVRSRVREDGDDDTLDTR